MLRLPKDIQLPPSAHLAVLALEEGETNADLQTLANAGGAFDFLREEPELYSDADILPGRRHPRLESNADVSSPAKRCLSPLSIHLAHRDETGARVSCSRRATRRMISYGRFYYEHADCRSTALRHGDFSNHPNWKQTGLKTASVNRADKLVTLNDSVISGAIGVLPSDVLEAVRGKLKVLFQTP